ncbi:MAG: MarC family protein [Gammaproteobacteria bacterium]|nr:MarC family protein [Gammaproteobacteria bacterium]MCP5195406.1 MarC family protein [Gammaproteobacteria bacterium]
MFEKFTQDALIIWATIDPIGTLALFAALTAHLPTAERRRTAIKAIVYAALVLLGAIVIGQLLLNAMGIRLISFQLGGGIILFLFGLQMIFGSGAPPSRNDPEHDIAVFPLAIPATATPGAILAVILLTDNHVHSIAVQAVTALIMLAVLAITLLLLLLAGRIIKIIGLGGASILTRVMGMILASLSVELVMNALGIEKWLQTAVP